MVGPGCADDAALRAARAAGQPSMCRSVGGQAGVGGCKMLCSAGVAGRHLCALACLLPACLAYLPVPITSNPTFRSASTPIPSHQFLSVSLHNNSFTPMPSHQCLHTDAFTPMPSPIPCSPSPCARRVRALATESPCCTPSPPALSRLILPRPCAWRTPADLPACLPSPPCRPTCFACLISSLPP